MPPRFADLQSAWAERLADAIAAAQDRESDEDDDERDGGDEHDKGNLFEFRV